VSLVSVGTQWPVPGYHSGFQNAGGIEVSATSATKGDIIQVGDHDDAWPLHTAIVVSNLGGGHFNVVDSNYQSDEIVRQHDYQPPSGARFWRMGTVGNGGSLVTGAWYLRNSNSSGGHSVSRQYGATGDIPLVGDWDRNGTVTVGVYRPSESRFYLSNSTSSQVADVVTQFGNPGDIPVVGDWDYEGTTTIGVYRPSNQTFYLSNSNTTGASNYVFQYGAPGDKPVVGNWNGDGFVTIGAFRPSNSTWYLRNSNTTGTANISVGFGRSTDVPVTGNWDGSTGGSNATTIGVYRPSNQTFYLSNSNSSGSSNHIFQYGNPGDVPVTGDWDDNGTTTIGVGR
jgi:hypothetical protein